MAHALDGARLKLGRANAHADTFNRQMRAFLDRNPYVLVSDSQPDKGKYVYRVRIRHPFQAETFGLVFGDAVHNFRAALDHVAYQLALGHSKKRIPDDDTRTQFPIFRVKDGKYGFDIRGLGQMHWMGDNAKAVIRGMQPYHAQNPYLHPLWLLGQYDNIDKHRVINLATAAIQSYSHVGANFHLPPQTKMDIEIERGPIVEGMELIRITLQVPDFQEHPIPNVTYQITLPNPPIPMPEASQLVAVEVLQAFVKIVEFVIARFSPAFGDGGAYDDGKLA